MKRILKKMTLLLATFMIFATGFSVLAVSAESAGAVYGDANGDGATDIRDIIRLKKYLTGTDGILIKSVLIDHDQNDIIDSTDLAKLRQVLLGVGQYNIIEDGYDYININRLS